MSPLPDRPLPDCKGHVVLLAGATGALGSAFARWALGQGASVAATVRRPWQVAKVREALGADRVLVGVVDAEDSEAAAGFVKGAGDALGPITALVATTGLFRASPVGQEPVNELRELLAANLLSGATLARAVLPGMRRRRRGTLTFVGSAAVGSDAPFTNYLASKAALHEYVRALSVSLRDTGVGVGAILPGTLDTAANRQAMPDADRSSWLPIDRAVAALAISAFGGPCGGPSGGGTLHPPLYHLPGSA